MLSFVCGPSEIARGREVLDEKETIDSEDVQRLLADSGEKGFSAGLVFSLPEESF
jgi:hypothetical protein